MSVETPTNHRLSPSGLFLGPWDLGEGSALRNVYKSFIPRGATDGSGMEVPTAAGPYLLTTFNIVLPTYYDATVDPPVAFNPNKLLYLFWVEIVADTIVQGATPGPANMVTYVEVDANGATTRESIQNQVGDADDDTTYSVLAGQMLSRSAMHNIPEAEADVVHHTMIGVFRPGDIPSWIGSNADLWVAGTTRHIHVSVEQNAETGTLWMRNRASRVVIAEFYGNASELIGITNDPYVAPT
jgi:hypothetical protein